MSSLYTRIEDLCISHGTNITEMCRKSGVSRSSLTDLKMGRTNGLNTNTLGKIATYFDVPMEYLLSGNSSGNMSGAIVTGSSVVIGDGKNIQSTVHNHGKEAELSSLESGILEKVRKLSLEEQVRVFNFITEMEGGKG